MTLRQLPLQVRVSDQAQALARHCEELWLANRPASTLRASEPEREPVPHCEVLGLSRVRGKPAWWDPKCWVAWAALMLLG